VATSPDDVDGWPSQPPTSIPPRVRGGPSGQPAYPATQPISGGYPAVAAPASGGYPAVPLPPPGQAGQPGGRPATGAYRPIQPPPPTGSYGPPATGAHRAVTPAAQGPPGRPTGGYPAVRQSGFGPVPHTPQGTGPPGSQVGPAPSSGVLPAVPPRRPTSDLGRVGAPSGQGLVVPNLVGQAPPAPTTGSLKAVAQLPAEGDELDGYKILKTIGKGSMGRVYRARDQAGRNVALKVILADQADAEGLARFEREGQAMAAVPRHKNVVNVHSTGMARGLPYLVCDLIDGTSLVEVLKRGPMAPAQAVAMGELLARAVEHCHRAGVLHRDLKPANILIRADDGEPVLADFGMAGMRGAEKLTRTGDLLGTPLYMPPEQVLGLHRQIDARSEVWSLGALIYEMLAGEPPFGGKSLVELSKAITQAPPRPLVHIDEALEQVLLRALAKKREERWPSAGALADALAAWRHRPSAEQRAATPRRPRRLVPALAAGAVASVALGAGAIVWKRSRQEVVIAPGSVASVATVASVAPTRNPLLDSITIGAGEALRAVRLAKDGRLKAPLADEAVDAALRSEALEQARARPFDVAALVDWLEAIGIVRDAFSKEGRTPPHDPGALGDAAIVGAEELLADVSSEDAKTSNAAGDRIARVFEAVVASRLHPGDRVATEAFLEALPGKFLHSAMSGTLDQKGALGLAYDRIMVASVDLDLDVDGAQLREPAGSGHQVEVIRVRVLLAGPRGNDPTYARRSIELANELADRLGPVCGPGSSRCSRAGSSWTTRCAGSRWRRTSIRRARSCAWSGRRPCGSSVVSTRPPRRPGRPSSATPVAGGQATCSASAG
jgi:hypothetical protein